MLLNRTEIENQKLLTNSNPDNFCAVSYDLSASDIITFDNRVLDSYDIPPQGMVIVVSLEEFNLFDKPVVGFTTVKNTLSRKGIMAVNVGLVDPGYTGPISSILINFGKNSVSIKKGEKFLRMTFHQFEIPKGNDENNWIKNKTTGHTDYVEQRKNEAHAYLDSTFLFLDRIKKQTIAESEEIANVKAKAVIDDFKSRIKGYIQMTSLAIGALGLFFGGLYFLLNRNSKEAEQKLTPIVNKEIENKLDSLYKKIEDLGNARFDTLKGKL